MMRKKQVVIIGGGPAGLAVAAALREKGVRDVLILEREPRLGGILNQCIHDGFGLTRFGESLSGPEYAERFIQEVLAGDAESGAAGGVENNEPNSAADDETSNAASGVENNEPNSAAGDETSNAAGGIADVEAITDCTVIDITPEKRITAVANGAYLEIQAEAILLTMGCRERPRGALAIPGDRPAGVYTAGVAQNYINLKNTMVGHDVVILGSGDIGMIMARRLTLEGAKVHAVFEILPYPSGLPRNVQQCLRDYDIPLFLSHTVTRINGRNRLESVTVSQVDEKMQPVPGTEQVWPCDTLILSVGLIPENELSLKAGVELDPRTKGAVVDEFHQTSVPGIFAAGNVLHVHDLVDYVSLEAEEMAEAVATYLAGGLPECPLAVETGPDIGYTVPQRVSGTKDVTLSFRTRRPLENCVFEVWHGGRLLASKRVPKAIPAIMNHIRIPRGAFHDTDAFSESFSEPIKVVSRIE